MKLAIVINRFYIRWFRRLGRWWALNPPWIGWLTLLALLIVLGWIIAKPLNGKVRREMIDWNYRAAMTAYGTHDTSKARELALAVILAGDKRIEKLRIMEQSAGEMNDPRYGMYAANLLAQPPRNATGVVFHQLEPDLCGFPNLGNGCRQRDQSVEDRPRFHSRRCCVRHREMSHPRAQCGQVFAAGMALNQRVFSDKTSDNGWS